MNKAEERAYVLGKKSTYRMLLGQCLRELGYMVEADAEIMLARLVIEREEAIVTLRKICAAHGDNDWPDNLDLSDILEKHLADHLC